MAQHDIIVFPWKMDSLQIDFPVKVTCGLNCQTSTLFKTGKNVAFSPQWYSDKG